MRKSPSRSVTLSGEDVTGLDFVGHEVVGPAITYQLAGQIRDADGESLQGVQVAIDPPVAADAVSDASGRYAFGKLQEGTYTIRPRKAGFTFDPAERTIAVDQDLSGQDFVGQKDEIAARQVEIRTKVPWEKWYDFYSDVLDPLMSAGAEIEIRLHLSAQAERELGSDLIERLRDSLKKYDEGAELDVGGK